MALLLLANIIVVEFLYKSHKRTVLPDAIKAYGLILMAVALPSLVIAVFNAEAWPLPGSYNIIFGDMASLFSLVIMAAGAVAYFTPKQLKLLSLPTFAVGALSSIYGIVIYINGMTQLPILAAGLFCVEGLAAMAAGWGMYTDNKTCMWIACWLFAISVMLLLGLLVPSIFDHAASFAKWAPA